jgi:uncharacterized protein YqeY
MTRSRLPRWLPRRSYATSDEPAPPPLLQKLKGDLKTAMRAKDTARLSVLRSIMTAALNASKTPHPIRSDQQLVALLRKSQKASRDAAKEFKSAGREDLAEKEEAQADIMAEYIADSGVRSLGEEELRTMVLAAVDDAREAGIATKALVGDVMKRLTGSLHGKEVDMKELASMVRDAVA